MPNTFGTSSNPQPLFDPRLARAHRRRFNRDTVSELSLANSFFIPGGIWPARGWVLMERSAYQQVSQYSTSLQLQIDDFVNPPLTFKNLALVQARCVTEGNPQDPLSVYLVELTDRRGVLWNPWGAFPTTAQYNIRAPAYPGQFYQTTLNGGVPWTWSTMLGDLWSQMGAILPGAFPGLPSAPLGTPEEFSFPGAPAWAAFNEILGLLGMSVAVDLTQANPYTIVSIGATDAAFTALQAKYAGVLEDDLDWLDLGSGRVAGKAIVFFHTRYQYYGTEETVRRDNLQWQADPLYQVSVVSPYPSAAGTTYLWDDFTVELDVDGVPLPADVATANAIAAQRTTEYFSKVVRGSSGFLRQVYAGVLPFKPASLLDGVRYKMDMQDQMRLAWRTEIKTGEQPPWPEVAVEPGHGE